MGEAIMKPEELEAIGVYVKNHITDWMQEANIIPFSYRGSNSVMRMEMEISLTERIVRVEEAIKHQGDLLEKLIHQIDKRFEQIDKRFDQIDKRFDQIDKRFEEVDKRFKQMFAFLTTIFLVIGTLVSIFGFLK